MLCEIMENSCQQTISVDVDQRFSQNLPVTSLEDEVKTGTKERIAKRKRETHKKRQEAHRQGPTVQKLILPSPPRYKQCQHSGNFILDREMLQPSDHINILAQPTERMEPKRAHYIVRKLPGVTNRVKVLAKPSPTHVKATLERYSSQLSTKQKHQLEHLLEPQLFVTISESIAYARQQRQDDALWRQHRAKQEKTLLRKLYRMERLLLRDTMQRVAAATRDYYLNGPTVPLEEDARRIALALYGCLCRFVDFSNNDYSQDGNITEQFYMELAEKIGHWIWRLMAATGMSLETAGASTESVVSVNSSAFELSPNSTTTTATVADEYEKFSQELVNDTLQGAVEWVENGSDNQESSLNEDEEDTTQQDTVWDMKSETVIKLRVSSHTISEDTTQPFEEGMDTAIERMSEADSELDEIEQEDEHPEPDPKAMV